MVTVGYSEVEKLQIGAFEVNINFGKKSPPTGKVGGAV